MIITQFQLAINAGSSSDGSQSPTNSQEILDSLMEDVNKAKFEKVATATTRRKTYRRPKGFQNKDKMIERHTEFFLKRNPNLKIEEAKLMAIKSYNTYIEKQRQRSKIKSQRHKERKEFINSVDPELAKFTTRDRSTKKVHFIAHKEQQIKQKYPGISHADASKMAIQMREDFVQKRRARQAKNRAAKRLQRQQDYQKGQQ